MKSGLKILILNWQDIKNPLSGGAEVHLHKIFEKIAVNNDVTLLCSMADGLEKEENVNGINVIRFGNRNTFNYSLFRNYRKVINDNEFDIVVDDINKIPFYTPLYVKRPLLAISHHFFGTSIFKETNPIFGAYVMLAERLINTVYKETPFAVVSQSTLDEFLSRGFNPNHFSIVPNAIDQNEYPMKVTDKFTVPTISYFGRLKKYKSVDHLLYASAKVLQKIPNLKLNIIGRGDFEPYLRDLAKKLNLDKNIEFLGFVEDQVKADLLSKSHIIINTSMKEGWGITNIEASACGTPVISANSPGLRDSVLNGQSGLLYEYGNIEELSNKIIEVLENNELRSKLEIGSIEWASGFSWDKSAEMMMDTIQKVLER